MATEQTALQLVYWLLLSPMSSLWPASQSGPMALPAVRCHILYSRGWIYTNGFALKFLLIDGLKCDWIYSILYPFLRNSSAVYRRLTMPGVRPSASGFTAMRPTEFCRSWQQQSRRSTFGLILKQIMALLMRKNTTSKTILRTKTT